MSASSNQAASVRQRLLNRARAEGEDFQALLTRYVIERLLYRLGVSRHRDRFVVKGAVLFMLWEGDLHRTTRDLDLLGFGSSAVADVGRVLREVLAVEVVDDGVVFDPGSVQAASIRDDQAYDGARAIAANVRSALSVTKSLMFTKENSQRWLCTNGS